MKVCTRGQGVAAAGRKLEDAMSRTFGIEYPWRDGKYILPVVADSAEDAMARVKQAANLGTCFTPNGMERIAIPSRLWADIVIGWRNWLRK